MALHLRFVGKPLASALAVLSLAAPLAAQPATPAPPAKPALTGTAETALDPTPPVAPSKPPPIFVDEQLLKPIPPAPKTLTNWRDAVRLVDTSAPDLRVAEQEAARAAGLSRQALGGILPTLRGSASVLEQSQHQERENADGSSTSADIEQSTTSANLTLSLPILRPRGWYAYGTARQAVEVAKLSATDRRRTLLTNVAASIVAVFTSERVSEINRVGLKTSLERLELTQRRARLGVATRLDVVRAEQDVALATNTTIQGDESLRRAREALGLALGEDVPYSVTPTISLNEIESSVRSLCAVGKPEDRADVQAAQRQLEVNRRQVKEVQLGFLPTADVSASLDASVNGSNIPNLPANVQLPPQFALNASNYSWSIRAVLTVPIFEGFRYGELAVTRANVEQQTARVEIVARQARLEVTQANRAVEVAESARKVSESTRDLAKETARLAQVAYEAGTSTSFELIDAARRQRESELDLVVREFELVRAKIAALLAAAVCDG